MTTRARYADVIVAPNGVPVAGATVDVYNTGTTTHISGTIHDSAVGGATLPNPIVANDQGEVEFWLDAPIRVDLKYSRPGYVPETHTVEVLAAAPPASTVVVTPTGAISSTDVQAALAELDTEKSSTSHTHSGTYERVFIPTAATGVAIQAAIDAANTAGGGTVVLSAYTEYLTDLRTIPGQTAYSAGIWMRSNVKLKAAKGSVIKLMNGATLPSPTTQAQIISTYYASTQSNIVIEDVELDANGANNPTLTIAHGIYTAHVQSAWIVRCKAKNLYGTLPGPPGETMHFETNYGRDVHYIDCEADGTGVTNSATGFSADNSFGVSWTGCVAHNLLNGQGFTHWQSAGLRYSGCHAYKCPGAAGFNSERSENVTYEGCVSGGRAPNVGSDTALPWFTSNQNLGNAVGFQISGAIDVAMSGCVATYNTTGIHIFSNTGTTPTLVCNGVTWVGGTLLHNTTPITVDASQVGVWITDVPTGTGSVDVIENWADGPLLTYRATNAGSGLRHNIVGYSAFLYRMLASGASIFTIGGGTDNVGGDTDRTDRVGDVTVAYNLAAEALATKYISAAGRTTLADADFAHRPANGSIGFIRDATTGITYRCTRLNGAWVVVPETATQAWRRLQTGKARFDANTATTTGLNEQGSNAPAGAAGGLNAFYIDPADYPTHAKLRVRCSVITNATAPASNFTAGLYPTTTPGGAAANVTAPFGTVTSGSTAAVNTPALGTNTEVSSADFAIPAAGFYALGLVISANMAASSSAVVRIDLEVKS